MGIDVRDYWNFDDPAASEAVFRSLLDSSALSRNEELEVWAQVARTFSLRRDCPPCHVVLDDHWDEAMEAGGRPKACFELERGRAFRTGKELDKAIPFFECAAESSDDDLKVDAMHMLAIDADTAESLRINLAALEFAKASTNPWAQRWQGTLYNNMGWSCFGVEKFDEALVCFQDALAQREIYGKPGQIRVAKWCVGRCLRALGRLDEALTIQLALKEEGGDEFVDEELAQLGKLMNKAPEEPGR